jgi:predicted PurR-regulated permease PerM
VLTYAAAAGLTALIVYLLFVGNAILLPFVIAIFVWHLANALAALIRKVRIGGRALPGAVRLGAAIVVLVGLLWLVVNLVVDNVGRVLAAAPAYEANLRLLATRLAGAIGLEELPRLQILFEGVTLTTLVRGLAGAVAGMLGSLGTVAIYLAFLLLEQQSFSKKIAALFPDVGRRALAHRILHRIGGEIQTYVWLKTVTSLLTGAASYAVMKAVGVDLAEFWALLIFALNYIPYIGALLGVVFPAALSLAQFDTLTPFLVTTGALTVVQFAIGSVLEPRLMGRGLNLSPVVMLLSLAFWGTLWGVVGMFLAVPLMVVVMIVCSHFEATRPIAVVMSAEGELRT